MMIIIFCDFLTFDQIFLSPQEKRSVIVSNKHGVYHKLLHKLLNDLRLRKTRNIRKISKFHRTMCTISHENWALSQILCP